MMNHIEVVTIIFLVSSLRSATIVPRIKYAVGSLKGLLNTGVILEFSIIPKSSNLLFIILLQFIYKISCFTYFYSI